MNIVGGGVLFVTRATRDYESRRASEDLGDRELMEKRFDGLERKLDNLAVTGQSG